MRSYFATGLMKQKYYWIFAVIVILGVVAVGIYFLQQKIKNSGKGFLEGKIIIGSICPAGKFPFDPNCQPSQGSYQNWPVAVWTLDRKTKIAQIEPRLDGSFKIELKPGEYIVDMEKQQPPGMGINNFPASITIRPEEITAMDINIDTGTR